VVLACPETERSDAVEWAAQAPQFRLASSTSLRLRSGLSLAVLGCGCSRSAHARNGLKLRARGEGHLRDWIIPSAGTSNLDDGLGIIHTN